MITKQLQLNRTDFSICYLGYRSDSPIENYIEVKFNVKKNDTRLPAKGVVEVFFSSFGFHVGYGC